LHPDTGIVIENSSQIPIAIFYGKRIDCNPQANKLPPPKEQTMSLELNAEDKIASVQLNENRSRHLQGNVFLGFFIPGQCLLLRSTENERNNQPSPVVTYKVSSLFKRDDH